MRTLKEKKERQRSKIFDMWLACWTQEEIAAAENCSRDDVREVKEIGFGESGNLAEFPKTASHATDFEPPIYNIWKQQEKTPAR